MIVYRISKTIERANDLSGYGAFKFGGRWKSKGTEMLYTSMNSSLAYLETLVHFEIADFPPGLYISSIEITDDCPVYELPDTDYPTAWDMKDDLDIKLMGDRWMAEKKYMTFKVRSAIIPFELNFLLNPLFPGFYDKAKVIAIQNFQIDKRLVR